MQTTETFTYNDFILLNVHQSFHPGGLMSTLRILSNIPGQNHTSVILDFGCGNGITLALLEKTGYRNLIGYDSSSEAIETCRQRHLDAQFCTNITTIKETHIDIILLESLLSFNDAMALNRLIHTLGSMITRYGVRHIAVIDYFSIDALSPAMTNLLKEKFGVKAIRTADAIQKIITGIHEQQQTIYYHEYPFTDAMLPRYALTTLLEQYEKNKAAAKCRFVRNNVEGFNDYLQALNSVYAQFPQSFRYFETIIAVQPAIP